MELHIARSFQAQIAHIESLVDDGYHFEVIKQDGKQEKLNSVNNSPG